MSRNEELIKEIETLLNSYKNVSQTAINPALLSFMDEESLLGIIESLLIQKEEAISTVDTQWLEQFKSGQE